MAAERVQQERAEHRRLEREEWKVRVEAERLRWEIKEAERKQRELEEAEGARGSGGSSRKRRELEEVEGARGSGGSSRKRRELEEAELEQLTWEKEQLEEEKRVEQQRTAALHGSERAVEWRRAALVASPPEAGLSQAPPQKPEWTRGWGLLSQRRIVHGCITWETLC